VAAKCKALFLSRLHAQGTRRGSATAALLRLWGLIGPVSNPPNVAAYPTTLAYVRDYVMDMAYISPPKSDETPTRFRRRIYATLHQMAVAATTARPIRVETLDPHVNWKIIWRNLHDAWITDALCSEWYAVIHDLLPTNDRLSRIALMDTDQCHTCGQKDTLVHRIIECGDGDAM
jgi:hypothetical protein